MMTHPSAVDRLQDFPRKYIKFNTHEKDLVISLFDVIAKVRKEVEGESYTVDDSITAIEYDNAMLEYDHEITEAMNFISNL